MKIGLYQLKYPARKWIEWFLPFVKDVNPNHVSLLMLPVGIAIAFCTYAGFRDQPGFLLAAFFLCLIRMFLGTLDGLMAVRFNKKSPTGELLNRLTPELCDAMYLIAILAARPEITIPGIIAITFAWLTSFSSMLGLLVGRPLQSIGPVGQTDRLVVFMLLLILQYFFVSTVLLPLFIAWCIGGGILTVSLRLWRTFHVSS